MTSKTPRYVTDTILNFIGDSYRQGSDGKTFINFNSTTAQKIGTALEASESDVAVAAATAALNGPWGRIKTADRLKLIGAAANEIERRSDDFIEAEVADTDKPRHLASHIDIPRGAANFRMFADVVGESDDIDYGLSEMIWTENVARVYRVAAAMRVGGCVGSTAGSCTICALRSADRGIPGSAGRVAFIASNSTLKLKHLCEALRP